MPDPVYPDANTLVYWAAGRAGSTNSQDATCHAALEQILASNAPVALSPVALAEYSTTLQKLVGRDQPPHDFFGIDEAIAAEQALMDLLATGRVIGRSLGPRAFEAGMSYVGSATREHR